MIFYSRETLFHFKCSLCLKWWSVGDFNFNSPTLFCPFCGQSQTLEEEKPIYPLKEKNK